MNKTININLGGLVFHIDEDAYQKLTNYIEAIKRSLSKNSGQEEIIKDIEIRIGELISEKHTNDKQVISLGEVEEIISIMGQPEDYRIEGDEPIKDEPIYTNSKITKKLYRDEENAAIGGVLAGLGHYFGVDKTILRVILLIMVFAWGTGFVAYIILWIAMPAAKTTSEKLEMRGEPVTISNIEKKVREEIESLTGKIKSTDFEGVKKDLKSNGNKIKDAFSEILGSIINILAKVVGALMIVASVAILIVFLIGVLAFGTSNFENFPFHSFIELGNFTDYPVWFFGLMFYLAVSIPSIFVLLLGIKIISPSSKSIGSISKYVLLGIWIIAIGILISIGVKQASEYAYDGRVYEKQTINLNPKDTLYIKFKNNDYYSKDINDYVEFNVTKDSLNQDVVYSNSISFQIEKTDEILPYVKINKEAKGFSFEDANSRAGKIKYGFKITGNQLILDNYLITELKDKYRDQKVEIKLYLPKGTLFRVNSSVKNFDYSDNSFFNLHTSSDEYIYNVDNSQVKCLNCPIDENDTTDREETTTVSVKVGGNKIIETVTKNN
ncbi:MAG: PspC domain-containing protein [Flavobacteriaceae bacterium]|nr:PspC domain-containing protein [Flavobacteriaceae bacterium]